MFGHPEPQGTERDLGDGGQEPLFVVSMEEQTKPCERAGSGLAGLSDFCGSGAQVLPLIGTGPGVVRAGV